MKITPIALLTFGCLSFLGCATGYQGKGLTGGYSDVRLDANTFRVEFRGNAYTSRQTVETFLLYRCAELTTQTGYDYFVTVSSDTEARRSAYTTPGSFNSTTTFDATAYGNTAYGSARTMGTFSPGQTFVHTRYGASTVIKVFKGNKPTDNQNAFNAWEVLQYLGPQVAGTGGASSGPIKIEETPESQIASSTAGRVPEREAPQSRAVVLQQKPEATKRYGQMKHTTGPAVSDPPQMLKVEYLDSGDGHGPARVIYPGNYVLDGEYRTIESGQNFKGLVNARLIDPDKATNFPNSSLRGFAGFAGADGAVMECVYAVTSPTGNGSGRCMDNRGNQYQLSF